MKFLIAIVILLSSISLLADDAPDLVTDRPDQTESANIVPPSWLQVETGMVYTRVNLEGEYYFEVNTLNMATTLFRYGIMKDVEIRLSTDYTYETSKFEGGERVVDGFGPLAIGTKINLIEETGFIPKISVIGQLTLPNTSNRFSPNVLEPKIVLVLAHDLPGMFSVGANLGYTKLEDAGNVNYSFVIGMGLTDKMGAFVEVFGDAPSFAPADHLFDGGLTYLILNNFQLDVSAGAAISEYAPDWFVSGGLSFRLPK